MPSGIYKRTNEHKEKISASKKGHSVSLETREKISQSKIGKKFSKKRREKLSEARKQFYKNGGEHPRGMLGKKQTPEHKKKISEANTGNKNWGWKGGRSSAKGGYIRVRVEKGVYMLEHRFLMEKQIGRKLKKKEVVHHIDGNRKNNDISNLILMKNQKEHREHHIKLKKSQQKCQK